MSSCWGAPRTEGVPAFAPGIGARRQLAALLGVAEEALDERHCLLNLRREPQPRAGWGRAFDRGAADAEEMRVDLAALGLVAG